MTDFEHIGAHCSVSSCNTKDFLPFTCELCKNKYCLDHRTADSHNCINLKSNRMEPLFCPICNQSISVKYNDNRNDILNKHIDNNCSTNNSPIEKMKKDLNKGICSLHNCNNRELIPVICKICKKQFCMKHRSELDHNCKLKESNINNPNNIMSYNRSECSSMCIIS